MKFSLKGSVLLCAAMMTLASCADEVDENARAQYIECEGKSKSDPTFYCLKTQICYEGRCVDSSDAHCGSMDNRCSQYETCAISEQSMCVCKATQMTCSNTCCIDGCKDTKNDSKNCGLCGNECGVSEICDDGVCKPNCPSNMLTCADEDGKTVCYAGDSDVRHCGACDTQCLDATEEKFHLKDSYCSGGHCMIVCQDGYENRDGNMANGCELSTFQCGDGMLQSGEDCDGAIFRDPTKTCEDLTHIKGTTGTLTCTNCKLDSSGCKTPSSSGTCGNGKIESGEACDGDAVEATCNYALNVDNAIIFSGKVTCNSDCTLNAKDCSYCGDGIVNGDEECDKNDGISPVFGEKNSCKSLTGFSMGKLGCTSDCRFDTRQCEAACQYGTGKCANATTMLTCTQKGTYIESTCNDNTPYCYQASDKAMPVCVRCLTQADCSGTMRCDSTTHTCIAQPTTTSYQTDFEWIAESSTSYKQTGSQKSGDIEISFVGRTDVSNFSAYKDGKAVILSTDKDTNSKIEVKLSKGTISKIKFGYIAWDAGKISVTSASGKETSKDVAKDASFSSKEKATETMEVSVSNLSTVTIKSTKRLLIDNLEITYQ